MPPTEQPNTTGGHGAARTAGTVTPTSSDLTPRIMPSHQISKMARTKLLWRQKSFVSIPSCLHPEGPAHLVAANSAWCVHFQNIEQVLEIPLPGHNYSCQVPTGECLPLSNPGTSRAEQQARSLQHLSSLSALAAPYQDTNEKLLIE